MKILGIIYKRFKHPGLPSSHQWSTWSTCDRSEAPLNHEKKLRMKIEVAEIPVSRVQHFVDKLPCTGQNIVHCYVQKSNKLYFKGPDHEKGKCPLCDYS